MIERNRTASFNSPQPPKHESARPRIQTPFIVRLTPPQSIAEQAANLFLLKVPLLLLLLA